MRRDQLTGDSFFEIGKSSYYVGPIGNNGTLFIGGSTKRVLLACVCDPVDWVMLGVWIVGEGWGPIASGRRAQCSAVAGWLMGDVDTEATTEDRSVVQGAEQ